MEENIVYSLFEKENNNYSLDFDKLYDEYKIADEDTIVDEHFAHTINYSYNYNVNELKKIIEFYNSYNNSAIKLIKKKKNDIIDAIVSYELDVNNDGLDAKDIARLSDENIDRSGIDESQINDIKEILNSARGDSGIQNAINNLTKNNQYFKQLENQETSESVASISIRSVEENESSVER